MDSKPIIQLRHIRKSFGNNVVLKDVSITVNEGKCLVIIGASGSGKSVILKHMVGLLRPDKGEIWFRDQRIDQLPERELMPIRQRFGFLFQMGALFDSQTVHDNIAFPLIEHTRKTPDEIKKIVGERLALVGLRDTEKKMPAELSGGQRKRVALARAIALEPQVVLYDEPTTGLDPIRSDVINELILKLQKQMKITSVVVTHEMPSVFKIADRIVMLHEGKVAFEGTPEEIQRDENPIVKQFVAGEASEKDLAAIRDEHDQSLIGQSSAGGVSARRPASDQAST